jgi:probable rRNA maturation factor
MLVDDGEITRLNKLFLKRRGPTDVIAFEGDEQLLGEIAISVDTARRQARERNIPLEHELMLLGIHGLLHLDGFDDAKIKSWREMKQAEFEAMVRII